MTRLALLAALLATPAAAEPCAEVKAHPDALTFLLSDAPVPDTVTVAPHDAYVAAVCYHNSAARNSESGSFPVEAHGLRITVGVTLESGPEAVTVTPPEGMAVLPFDMQSVEDGEGVTFWIAEVKG